MTSNTIDSPSDLTELIGQLALNKKAEHVLSIDVRGLTSLTDYFMVCSADTDVQVKSIADEIRRGTPHKPVHIEGYDNLQWVLLDYIDVVVHIFKTRERHYYNIEKLWADAPTIEISDEFTDLSQSAATQGPDSP